MSNKDNDKGACSFPVRVPRDMSDHFGFDQKEYETLIRSIGKAGSERDLVVSYWRFIHSDQLKASYCHAFPYEEIEHSEVKSYGPYFATADAEQRNLGDWLCGADDWAVFELITAPRI